jgi:hypothetical protein
LGSQASPNISWAAPLNAASQSVAGIPASSVEPRPVTDGSGPAPVALSTVATRSADMAPGSTERPKSSNAACVV